MYLPDSFRLDDRAALFAHAEAYPFATVITHGEGGVAVSHLPLLVDAGRDLLRGHLARENPQLAHLAARTEVLAIFHGPHGYISPSAYTERSEEHTSELQSLAYLVCRLLLEKKKKKKNTR